MTFEEAEALIPRGLGYSLWRGEMPDGTFNYRVNIQGGIPWRWWGIANGSTAAEAMEKAAVLAKAARRAKLEADQFWTGESNNV